LPLDVPAEAGVYGEWMPHALAPVVPIVLAPRGAVRTGDDQPGAAPAAQAVRPEVGGERLEQVGGGAGCGAGATGIDGDVGIVQARSRAP
jgi:hypothetical protein